MARFISISVVGGADAFEDGQHLINTESVITVTSGDEAGANEGTKTTIHTNSAVLNTVVLTHGTETTPSVRDAINSALTANPGGVKSTVGLPSGIAVTEFAVV
ncbi:hypothetical protein DRO61_04375 [Candidatus Bathyarchaeota archaeon]|jgi:hypothetical protein|nr:MAG: hypothetical protein DRO61_04375 [Candidatus Bathyarchaeota archaeon]